MTEFSSTYQKKLLSKYIDGTITATERHELEKMALDDPFLFDALEGYSLKANKDKTPVISLDQKSAAVSSHIKPYYKWIGLAASLAILLGVFWVLNPLDKNIDQMASNQMEEDISEDEETASGIDHNDAVTFDELISIENTAPNQIVQTDEKASQPISTFKKQRIVSQTAPPTPEVQAAPILVEQSKDEQLVQVDLQELENETPSQDAIADVSEVKAARKAVTTESNTPNSTTSSEAMETLNDDNVNEDERAEELVIQNPVSQETTLHEAQVTTKIKSLPYSIKGKVTDDFDEPLIGANVLWKGTNYGTITDMDGEFQLTRDAGIGLIEISYTGYYSYTYKLTPTDTFLNLTLDEAGGILDEVVVTGYSVGQASRKKNSPEKSRLLVTPVVGFEAFYNFINLERNKATCPESGFVNLQFIVKKDGTLTKIKVKDSMSTLCGREAIRLLRAAGKWQTNPAGWRKKVSFTMVFE